MNDRPLKPAYFDDEEKALMEAIEQGEFEPSPDGGERLAALREAAANSLGERESKNIPFYKRDLQRIRVIASQKGIPYQTLIASIIHQYANGQLKEG